MKSTTSPLTKQSGALSISSSFEKFFNEYDCLTITGPTGVGKTGLALSLAEVWPIEIISMDSALVYKSMDIGTAKPSAAELARVPHHLINIRSPLEAYNAAEFAENARQLITEIRAKGKLPVIVGGTLLYFKALFEGLNELPKTDPNIRDTINEQARAMGWPALHAQLQQIDAVTAARLSPNDAQRISRALEVWRSSGRALSSYFIDKPNNLIRNKLVSLEPISRAWLHERLALRFHQMLSAGFIDEVKELKNTYALSPLMPSMRCVGYRQIWEFLEAHGNETAPSQTIGPQMNKSVQRSQSTQSGERQEMIEQAVAATRQLAKRQLTWLRSIKTKEIIECDKEDGQRLTKDLFKILKIEVLH